MTRKANDKKRFTPFSRWIRKWCKDSGDGLSLTNLDYIITDFKQEKMFLLEEKQYMSDLKTGQKIIFKIVNEYLKKNTNGYEYWGFYLIQLPKELPGIGMKLNYKPITKEELKKHIDFEEKFCDSLF